VKFCNQQEYVRNRYGFRPPFVVVAAQALRLERQERFQDVCSATNNVEDSIIARGLIQGEEDLPVPGQYWFSEAKLERIKPYFPTCGSIEIMFGQAKGLGPRCYALRPCHSYRTFFSAICVATIVIFWL
jgi:hypothetical protein